MGKLNIKRVRPDTVGLIFILGIGAILLLRELGNSNLYTGDSAQHLMDGVFLLDFLKAMPISDIYDYTISYYTQYPALGIGYRPPFFPFIEAIFNGIFGLHVWSSRLAIFSFFFVGIIGWFKLVQRAFNTSTAFWASLLLVTTPFVVQWGWYTMAELPALSMVMVTAYVFYLYTENQRPLNLYVAAILLSLTLWTKQTTGFLVLWFFLYVTIKGDLLNYLKRKEVWIAILISAILITPLALITFWLGSHNIAQSMGHGAEVNPFHRLSIANLTVYFKYLINHQLTPPVLVLTIIGIIWTAVKRERRGLYFAVGIVSTYVFFSYVVAKLPRYTIFWIPAFLLFAVLPLYFMRHSKGKHVVGSILMAVIICYQVSQVYSRTPYYATGYKEAAKYVLSKSKSPTVFFDGGFEALFVYFMRALDPNRSMYVLRGRKTLSSSVLRTNIGLEVHATSALDIKDIFDRYGLEYIVVEKKKDKRFAKIHQILRDFLEDGPFELVKEIPVQSNHPKMPMREQTLRIYRYLDPKPITADYIEIRLPAVGQTIRAPIRHLSRPDLDE
jgi:hypothetical protein